MWQIYFVPVNQITVATSSQPLGTLDSVDYLLAATLLSRKSWLEPQALKYRINWEIYTPYTGAVRILLHWNGKIEIISVVVEVCFYQPPLSISRCMSRYEADIAVSVESFISSAMRKMRSAKSQNLQLLSEKTSSILADRANFFRFSSEVYVWNLPLTSKAVTRREGKYSKYP